LDSVESCSESSPAELCVEAWVGGIAELAKDG
jgi:hypothetical protein